ncbi:MAG: hypothetical protein JNL10_09065 [Verrucomicrobiales bacterium]|nr:hypothetical protein [Verrucomicrobiales bacterium]
MPASKSQVPKAVLAVALLVVAGILVWKFVHENHGISEQAFFYDLSEKKLFVAERGLVPPIRGINDPAEDGVRAVVVSPAGKPEDKSTWTIAYLETCTPELKQQLNAARASGTAPEIGRTAAQSLRLVRRVGETNWFSLASPEGERIVSEWTALGANGSIPVVCSP